MAMQTASALAIGWLAASALWTASDPFVGKWKLDPSRSVIVDQVVVEVAGPSKYTFRFEGFPAETVVADGSDQPGVQGTTLSVKAEDARTLKVVRKAGGRTTVSATWKLADDGKTFRDAFAALQSDGSTLTIDYLYRRMSPGAGFAGTWESTTPQTGLLYELQIQPYGGAGLSFVSPGSVKSVTFDGQDHAVPGAANGLTASGRRGSARAMGFTEKAAGKVLDTRSIELSRDGKTLTMTLHRTGQATPDRLVFDRA